ncbi:hypothetical protein [Arthrobacter oryzae]|uniref:hypothetical protein n=1 Tax=Arthrobacter oryzae TaxID=409290 RepID=UPI0027855255|nr:hypothetical protein [Arthrobacter oryzae]MDQ0076832.1 hypothetical protein [Arthrobacter oryzae]
MKHAMSLLAALALGATALSGCSGGATASQSQQVSAKATPSPSPTKTVPVNGEHYSSVQSLKEAFVLAGGVCSGYTQTDNVTLAAQSGTCGKGAVLTIYSSVSDRDGVVANMKQFADIVGMNLLVGENWIINDASVATVQPKLGGTLFTRQPKKS